MSGVEQSIQTFLNAAKNLEAFFLQKRLLLSVQKPELVVKEVSPTFYEINVQQTSHKSDQSGPHKFIRVTQRSDLCAVK